jgi:hypothetical protein
LGKPLSLANLARVLADYLGESSRKRKGRNADPTPLPPDIAAQAHSRFAAGLQELSEALDRGESKKLIEALREFALRHSLPALEELTHALALAVANYDLGAIEELVARFTALIGENPSRETPGNALRPE